MRSQIRVMQHAVGKSKGEGSPFYKTFFLWEGLFFVSSGSVVKDFWLAQKKSLSQEKCLIRRTPRTVPRVLSNEWLSMTVSTEIKTITSVRINSIYIYYRNETIKQSWLRGCILRVAIFYKHGYPIRMEKFWWSFPYRRV